MDRQGRREALRQYKERKVPAGAYAVRCTATDQVWVGVARDLDQKQNAIWFALKQGGHMNRELQAAWKAHGEAAFAFQQLEVLKTDDLSRLAVDLMLKDAEKRWRAQLGAGKAVG